MDYTAEIENVKNELRSLGFTEDKLNQLLDLATQEALSIALEDLKESSDTLDDISSLLENTPTTAEDAINQLNMVFQKAYGDNYENKKLELIYQYLKQTAEDTKSAKDLYARYQAGDPSAVAFVKSQENNPDVQDLAKQIQQ